MDWKKLFSTNKTQLKELEEENSKLKESLKDCEAKLVKRQEDINKTNAYWKKKVADLKKDKKSSNPITLLTIVPNNNQAEKNILKYRKAADKFVIQGSASEVKSMLYLAKDLGYIPDKDFDFLFNLVDEISKMLSGLIKKLN